MSTLVLDLKEVGKTQLSLVGGKGLNLGELTKIQGVQVPEGFCVQRIRVNGTDGYVEIL